MLKILSAPNPILNQKLTPVNKIDANIIKILKDMEQTLLNQKDPPGVGLAANQVGINLRIFLALIDNKITPFINPEILKKSTELYPPNDGKNHLLEGCLSLHGYYGLVRHPKWVVLKAITVSPNTPLPLPKSREAKRSGTKGGNIPNNPNLFSENTRKYVDFPAQVIQHEMDHLNGHIFVERVLEQKQKLYRLSDKDKSGKTVFEEVELT